MRSVERSLRCAAWAATLFLSASSAHAATVQIVVLDGPGEGFNDPSPRAPVAGNSGTTLGAQRLNVFQAAGNAWGRTLQSNVTIRVEAEFDQLTCNPSSAVLGAAGPNTAHRDFSGAPVASTWYAAALANARHGSDLDAVNNDLGATFNSRLDEGLGAACLGGNTWWYGIGAAPPAGSVGLYLVVLHEIGHGLGFTTFYNPANGAKFMGFDDAYLRRLRNDTTGEGWSTMTDGERLTSQVNTGNLTWTGPAANETAGDFQSGAQGGRLRLFAPNPVQPGSSVSHWDAGLAPNEFMEPSYTIDGQDYATYRMMSDIGWIVPLIFRDGFGSQNLNFWSSATP